MNHDHVLGLMEGRVVWPDEQMAEVLLLLPGRQAAALECLAHTVGLTMGHLIRLLIHDYLTAGSGPGSINKLHT